jgi:hypothetical protein
MAKKQETVLNEVAEKIGSAIGVLAAEAAKVVRPLTSKRAKRSQAHSPSRRKRTAVPARQVKRNRAIRKRTRRGI